MKARISRRVTLDSGRIEIADAKRQRATAAEILRRLDRTPGQVLADEVGMGKTFVALAVAVSVIEATGRKRPVVVMVPPSVKEKWPREWDVFNDRCLRDGPQIRATEKTIERGSEFLKLLDDPGRRRKHLIFMTHGAFTGQLQDHFIRLAIVRAGFYRRHGMQRQKQSFARWATRVMPGGPRWPEEVVLRLLDTPLQEWRAAYRKATGELLDDDPVPEAILATLEKADKDRLTEALRNMPLREGSRLDIRLARVRDELRRLLQEIWRDCIADLDLRLPLLILDEAHHLKNAGTHAARLFVNEDAERETEPERGELANAFERMLFLTATPMQLGHHELIGVLSRFEGIRWTNSGLDRRSYEDQLRSLSQALDRAQAAALQFERAWSRVTVEDLATADGEWWSDGVPLESQTLGNARRWYQRLAQTMSQAERQLRPLVIRHGKDSDRSYLPGSQILKPEGGDRSGLPVDGTSLLPFLLAVRTQAMISARDARENLRTRAYFAEGIASSFEAYIETRDRDVEARDETPPGEADAAGDPTVDWYLGELSSLLPRKGSRRRKDRELLAKHPKIEATSRRAVELWSAGEKVLVFCFFRATGRALRDHISAGVEAEIARLAIEKRQLTSTTDPASALENLERLGDRFFDPDAPVTKLARRELGEIFSVQDLDQATQDKCIAIAMRFLRTPSFLARYLDLNGRPVDSLARALEHGDISGRSLRQRLEGFAEFVVERVESERNELLTALERLPTRRIRVGARQSSETEQLGDGTDTALPGVRMATGEVPRETRRWLMLGFNSPFFPEILVASSVMAEGVDLHLNCRHVIHHDLAWNPSVLEQRTGRLDRLGSHSKVSGNPIEIFEPFIAGTQDEKCFRVVKDRERWFNVVMGERLELDEASTDRVAARALLPEGLVEDLRLDLSVKR